MTTKQKFDFAKWKFKKFAIQHISTNFSIDIGCLHKIDFKKSNMVKIAESEQKYGIYLFKVETFLSKKASSKHVSKALLRYICYLF